MTTKTTMDQTIEAAIGKITGVVATKIVRDDKETILEVHVLANKRRHAKQISKDVQSLLAAQFDVLIDHRLISVAQVDSDDLQEVLPRIIYKSVDVSKEGSMMTATVCFTHQDQVFDGKHSGVITQRGDFRVVAEATIDGMRRHLKPDEHLVLEGFKVHDIADIKLANTIMTFVKGKRETTLVGTSLIQDNLYDAYVKSVLDALNRVMFK